MKRIPHLYAPEGYFRASVYIRQLVSNGCGTDGWKGKLVPETIWGLNISAACDIHDWMYAAGATTEEKQEADRVFLNNLLRSIEAAGGWGWLQALRRRRAMVYYRAVKYFGGPAFWADKNKEINFKTAEVLA
jgi:hypothetical protein